MLYLDPRSIVTCLLYNLLSIEKYQLTSAKEPYAPTVTYCIKPLLQNSTTKLSLDTGLGWFRSWGITGITPPSTQSRIYASPLANARNVGAKSVCELTTWLICPLGTPGPRINSGTLVNDVNVTGCLNTKVLYSLDVLFNIGSFPSKGTVLPKMISFSKVNMCIISTLQ